MTYTFDVKLFDNEIDSGYERFSFSALKQFAKMACGKKGTFGGKQIAEVLEAMVVVDREKTTKAGDPFCWVKARMKVELNDETSQLIYAMEAKEKNAVSVGCSVEHRICSICGGECCGHVPGDVYGGQLCYKELYGANEIYEWKFMEPVVSPKKEDRNNRPRICDVLGVDVEERFTYPGMPGEFYVTKTGKLKNVRPDGDDLMICVPTIINNQDLIMKVPKWTQQEVEDAKTIQRVFGKAKYTHVEKTTDGDVKIVGFAWGSTKDVLRSAVLQPNMFDSLKPGQTVELEKIVSGK